MKQIKRIILSLLVGAVVPLLFFVGGYNFNERGADAVFCTAGFLYLFGLAYIFFQSLMDD